MGGTMQGTNRTMFAPRRPVFGVGLGALAIAAVGSWAEADVPPASSSVSAAGAGRVIGTVVDGEGWPLPGQLVALGAETTTTDRDGRFTLHAGAPSYDLTIATPDRISISIYRGVNRRDPLLVHALAPAEDHSAPTSERSASHAAQIVGKLTGGGPYPLSESAAVHFASQRASGHQILGGPNGTGAGPGYGPLKV